MTTPTDDIFAEGEALFLARDIERDGRVFTANTICQILSHNKETNTVVVTLLGKEITISTADLVEEPDNPLLPFASVDSRPSQSEPPPALPAKTPHQKPTKETKPTKKAKKKEKPKTPSSWSCCFAKSTISDSDSSDSERKVKDPSPGITASPPPPDNPKPSLSGSMKEQKEGSPLKVSFSGTFEGGGKEENASANSIPIKAIASSSSSGKPTTGETSVPELFDSKKVWEERGMNSTVELLAASAASDLNAVSPPAPLNTPASPLPLAVPAFPGVDTTTSKVVSRASTSSHDSTEKTAPVVALSSPKEPTEDELKSTKTANNDDRSSHSDDEGTAAQTTTTLAETNGGLAGTVGLSELSRTTSRDSKRSRRRRDRSDSAKKDKKDKKDRRERRSSSRRSRSERGEKERRRRTPSELAKVPEKSLSRSVDGSRSPLVSPPQSTFCVPPAAIPIDGSRSSLHPPIVSTGITSMTSMTSSLEVLSINPVSSSTDTTTTGIPLTSITSTDGGKVDELFGKGLKSEGTSRAPYHKFKEPTSPVEADAPDYGCTPVPSQPKAIESSASTPREVQTTTPVHVDAATQQTPLSEMVNSPGFVSPTSVGPGGLVMTASITKMENEFIGIDVEQETFIIKSIAPDGAAARAGLDWRFIGMRLTHINGVEIRGIDDAARLATSRVVTIICAIPQDSSNQATEHYNRGWHDGYNQASYPPAPYSPVSPPRIWSPGYRRATTASYAAASNPIDEWKTEAKGVMGYTKVKWVRSPVRGDSEWIDSLRGPVRSSSKKRRFSRNR